MNSESRITKCDSREAESSKRIAALAVDWHCRLIDIVTQKWHVASALLHFERIVLLDFTCEWNVKEYYVQRQ